MTMADERAGEVARMETAEGSGDGAAGKAAFGMQPSRVERAVPQNGGDRAGTDQANTTDQAKRLIIFSRVLNASK